MLFYFYKKYYTGIMKRTTRNAAKTKQEIIEKSAPVFNIHGYAGTKMQMLIDATGYQMGGIYRHFETKKHLAKAVFQYNYEVLIKKNLSVDAGLNPKEQLLAILENYRKMVLQPNIAGGCPLLNTAIEVDDTDKELSKLAKTFVKEVLAVLENILTEGKLQGVFQSGIEPKKEASFILASFEGAIMLGKIMKKASPVFAIFERILFYLEDRIFKS